MPCGCGSGYIALAYFIISTHATRSLHFTEHEIENNCGFSCGNGEYAMHAIRFVRRNVLGGIENEDVCVRDSIHL